MKKILFLIIATAISATSFATTADNNKEPKQKEATTTFSVTIDCQGCVTKIMNYIPFKSGVKDVKVNLEEKSATVTYRSPKCDEEKLIEYFDKIDITAKPLKAKAISESKNKD